MQIAKNILILALIIVVLFFVLAPNDMVADNKVITKIDTIIKHDTLRKYQKGDSIPFVILDTIYQIDQIHDTAYIVNDYNKIKVYTDTLRINTDNSVYIKDTITQNRILGRSYFSNFTQKTIRIETIKTEPSKIEVYLGLLGDLRRFDEKVGIGVGFAIKVPKKGLFTFGATTNQYSIGYYAKF